MRRVVSFPADASAPAFQWLPIKAVGSDRDDSFQMIDARPIMGDVFPSPITSGRNKIIDAELDNAINLCFDDNFLTKYSDDNAAVLATTNRRSTHSWRGPMLAYCGKLRGQEIVEVADMDMNTLSDLVALLIDYNNDSQAHKHRKGPKVQGVRAHCRGELSNGLSKTVMVPRMHPVFDDGEISEISKLNIFT